MTHQGGGRETEVRSSVPGILWPGLPGPHGEVLLALLFQLEQSQWWSPQKIHRAQWRQLEVLLDHARAHSPWYRDTLPARPATESWHQVPVLQRETVQRQAAALRCGQLPPEHGERRTLSTTGSTARPLRVERSDLAMTLAETMVARDELWHGRDLSGSLAVISTSVEEGRRDGWGGLIDAAFRTGPCHKLNARTPIEEQLRWLQEVRPDYLLGLASNIDALALLSLQRGASLPGLKGVRCFGEALPAGIRERVRQAWGAPLTDAYSCTETGTIALQCPEREHYHVMSEHLLVEVVDGQGRPCRPGEWGRVLLTTLHNFAMPLIRYELGDYAELGGPCDCGRGLPVLRRVLGRRRNLLVTPDGRRHWPSFPARIWLEHPQIRRLRLVQAQPDRIRVELVADAPLPPAAQERLAARLRDALAWPFELDFIFLDRLPELTGHKREDFVCLLDQEPSG